MNRFQVSVGLHVIVRDEVGRVLLGERCDTGWADGRLGLPSGHLEAGESAIAGAIREAEEEAGVLIKPDDLRLVHVIHHYADSGRLSFFFEARTWSGEITNREPDKCLGWSFLDPYERSNAVAPYVAEGLRHSATGVVYAERG